MSCILYGIDLVMNDVIIIVGGDRLGVAMKRQNDDIKRRLNQKFLPGQQVELEII